MNMFARFDENPAMTLRVIKETKRYGRTHGRTHGRTDNVKTVYPLQTKFAGGIKITIEQPNIKRQVKSSLRLSDVIMLYVTFQHIQVLLVAFLNIKMRYLIVNKKKNQILEWGQDRKTRPSWLPLDFPRQTSWCQTVIIRMDFSIPFWHSCNMDSYILFYVKAIFIFAKYNNTLFIWILSSMTLCFDNNAFVCFDSLHPSQQFFVMSG